MIFIIQIPNVDGEMASLRLERAYLPDVRRMIESGNVIAIVPIGSTEQHGPHLPFGTDAIIAESVSLEVADRLKDKLNILVVPTIRIGCSAEHMDFPGTLSLRLETMISLIKDVCASLSAHGIKKIVLLNAHGGNTSLLKGIIHQLRREIDALVVVVDTWSISSDVLAEIRESPTGGAVHAGEAETSLMLALDESLVKWAEARSELPRMDSENKYFRVEKPRYVSFSWCTADISRSGVIGDPTKANEEKGRRIRDFVTNAICEMLEELSRINLAGES